MKAKTLTVSVMAPPRLVYAFASNPHNLPLWAPAFCKSVEYKERVWVINSQDNPAEIEFIGENTFGVLDHTITLASGLKISNSMRVIPNGENSEVLFTLLQTSNMDELQFKEDSKLVESDLNTLKRLVEKEQGIRYNQ